LKIGIFGGTFNPPHIGHLQSAKTAAKQLGLDRLLIVPAGAPPHKPLPEGTPSADVRLSLVHATFDDVRGAAVSDIEIKDSKFKYTVDTVKAIKKEYNGARMFLLVGADMFLSLGTWKDSESLLKSVTPAVFSRNADDNRNISVYSDELQELFGTRTEIIENDVLDISSSQLRRLLPQREGVRYITDTTYSYIIKGRLYGAKPDWAWLRGKAYAMLDPKRVPHVAGCESEAVKLAERWGADVDDAREAGILHDITKKLDTAEHIGILAQNGIYIKNLQNSEEKLLHPKSGAALARTVFGVSDEVSNAIMWHTTGRRGMSLLEKVIYLADYIEPERDIPGIDELRKEAYADIDKAMIMGMEMSVDDMRSRGIIPNTTTFDALDDLRERTAPGAIIRESR